MPAECNPNQLEFARVAGCAMIAAFYGSKITTDGIVSLVLSAPVSALWSNICLTMPLRGAFFKRRRLTGRETKGADCHLPGATPHPRLR
jgi:hypothetical protein